MPVSAKEEARRQKLFRELDDDKELDDDRVLAKHRVLAKQFGVSWDAYREWVRSRGFKLRGSKAVGSTGGTTDEKPNAARKTERTRSRQAQGPRTKAKAERGKEFFGPHVSVEAVEPEEIIARQRNRPARPGTSIDFLEYAGADKEKRLAMLRERGFQVKLQLRAEAEALVAAYEAACEYIVALKRVLDSMQIAHTDRLRFYESEFRNAQYLYQEARHGREGSP